MYYCVLFYQSTKNDSLPYSDVTQSLHSVNTLSLFFVQLGLRKLNCEREHEVITSTCIVLAGSFNHFTRRC